MSPDTPGGREGRDKIKNSIEKSRESDAVQEAATSVYFRAKSLRIENTKSQFMEAYTAAFQSLASNASSMASLEQRQSALQDEIDQIDDSTLQDLRDQLQRLRDKRDGANVERGSVQARIEDAQDRIAGYERDLRTAEAKSGKSDSGALRVQLARLTKNVFSNVIESLKNDELRKVSDEMNRIFLSMIGADPEKNDLTLITKAELTDDYDIRVFGPHGHELNPDQDLNGASRRAITLSFILALTKVSQVEAPNVIDTPLGMTSGYVKQSMLLQTLREGSQVIMFLTHDEIKGVEEIIDKHAGEVYTLTNPAHYPKMLKNEPSVGDSRILRCECDHRSSCDVCERKDAEVA